MGIGPIPAKTRSLIGERSGGTCEACGRSAATNIHHRKYRSRGGTHEPHNLIALCGLGNASGCHGRAHGGEGLELGWSIPRWGRSEIWPAYRIGAGWVIYFDAPDADGNWWQPISQATADLIMNGNTQ